MGDENRLQFPVYLIVIWKALHAVFLGVKPGVEEDRDTVHLEKVGVRSDLLPSPDSRKGPSHVSPDQGIKTPSMLAIIHSKREISGLRIPR